jgi:amidase
LSLGIMASSWESKVAGVREHRDASLAKVEPAISLATQELPLNSQKVPASVLTARELELTEGYTVKELLAKLRSREIKVEEVTRAFLRRAAVAQASVSRTRLVEAFTDVARSIV